jgi:hypothetical protein
MNNSGFTNDDERRVQRTKADVADQAARRLTKIKKASLDVRDEVRARVREQPLVAVGVAIGGGFVLGSVLGSRLGRAILVAAAGYATQEILESVLGEGGLRRLVTEEASKLAPKEPLST